MKRQLTTGWIVLALCWLTPQVSLSQTSSGPESAPRESPAQAAPDAPAAGQPDGEASSDAPANKKLTAAELISGVVGIHSYIPAGARTAASLGTERRGSGAIIDSNGLVVTIGYIILEAEKIEIVGRDDAVVPAAFVGYDADSGFGLVRALKPLKGRPLEMGASRQLSDENPVLVVTHGGMGPMTSAVIVSRRAFAGYWEYLLEDAIFTAPPMNNFAGAALIDTELRLVGIGSLFVRDAADKGYHSPGNMFVPIDRLYPIMADLIANGRPGGPVKPWIGIYVTEMFGRVVVTRTAKGGPAESHGLKEGDILLTVGGEDIADTEDFYRKLWQAGQAGVNIDIGVLQGTRVNQLGVRSEDRYRHFRNLPYH